MVVMPFAGFPSAHYEDGIEVSVVGIRRNHQDALDPAIKSNNLLNNVLAIREAQAKGAQEAILLNLAGRVAEGASTNVFVVRSGRTSTPPVSAGILHGITRAVLLEVAREVGEPIEEADLGPEGLRGADEVFVTSSTRELMPVRAIDGRPVGGGRPGPVTRRLLAAFRERAPRYCVP
jgi:branched-chain amino acid aminotransferase